MKAKRGQSQRAKLAGLKPKRHKKLRRVKGDAHHPSVLDKEKLKPMILERMADGELLKDICADQGIKSMSMVWYWMSQDEEFAKGYEQAKVWQARAIANEIQEIADGRDARTQKTLSAIEVYARQLRREKVPGWQQRIRELEKNLIARNRLQVDARKWYARSLNPKEFGEKIDMTSDGQQLPAAPPMQIEFVNAKGKATG